MLPECLDATHIHGITCAWLIMRDEIHDLLMGCAGRGVQRAIAKKATASTLPSFSQLDVWITVSARSHSTLGQRGFLPMHTYL